MEREDRLVTIENTRFIFMTNFSGDPARDNFGSTARKANLVIPDPEVARILAEEGFNVKSTKPKPGEEEGFVPTNFIAVHANYNTESEFLKPKIYLVSNGQAVLLDEDTVSNIDHAYVLNVNAVLNKSQNKVTGRKSLYIRTMYVEQDISNDPFASRYMD